MEQSVITEHDCNVLGGLFQIIVNDLKVCHREVADVDKPTVNCVLNTFQLPFFFQGGASTWEDFLLKASKFQNQLK